MTEFVVLNLPSCSFKSEESTIPEKVCVCCLRKKVPFTNLASCNHSEILDNLLETKMIQSDNVICCWCHSMLRKIYNFKMQAIESFNILNAQINGNIKDYWKNLEFSHIEQLYAVNSESIQSKTIKRANKNEPCDTKIEVKIEQDDISDFENDLPLVEITKKIQTNKYTDGSVEEKQIKRKDYWKNLEFSHIEQLYAVNSESIQSKIIKRANKNEPCDTEIEVKIEQDDISDFENDLPLVEITKKIQTNKYTDGSVEEKQIKRKINKKPDSASKSQTAKPKGTRKTSLQQTKKQSSTTETILQTIKLSGTTEVLPQTKRTNKCGEQVRIVYLTEEQMWEERRQEAENGRYLKLLYKCDRCLTGFDHELTLAEHMEKRHKKEPGSLVCKVCDSVLGSKYSYDEHLKRHYRRYECTVCGKRNNNVYSVLKHYSETHGKVDMTFKCKLCDFTTESHTRLRYHSDKHRHPKVECCKCGKVFVNNNGLRVHMFNIHKISNRVYACEPCDKVYSNRSALAQHDRLKHGDAAPAYCAPCDITFRSDAELRRHLKNSSRHVSEQDKRFQCSSCGSRFMSKSLLQEHVDIVHLDSTKHTCTLCNKAFSSGRSLKRHVSCVHEHKRAPRNKICDHCGRAFRSSVTLLQHIRTHTGERPLKCARCGAAFAHSGALYRHNKLVHKQQLNKVTQ